MTSRSVHASIDIPRQAGTAALVLGADIHALAVARALADAGIEVFLAERDPHLPGVATNRAMRVFSVPSLKGPELVPALLQLRQQLSAFEQVVLVAINDRQVELIGQHRQALGAAYRISWLGCADAVVGLLPKSALRRRCEQVGLHYPATAVLHGAEQAAFAAWLRFPVILKPVRPLSSFKTLLARDYDELETLLRQYESDMPVLAQEYIAGDDTHLFFGAVILERGEVRHGMVGRKLASFPPARGQTTVAETVHEPEVLALTQRFFAGTGISGPASLELKRDSNGVWWVIEPTVGRSDFWVQLCIGAGFNIPLLEVQLALGLPLRLPSSFKPCVWYDSERDPLAYARLCLRERSLRPRGKSQLFPYARQDDRGPLWRAWWRLMQRKVGGAWAQAQPG